MPVLESITKRFLLDVLCSREFVGKLGETALQTYGTGNEHSFEVLKRVNSGLQYSEVSRGTPKNVPSSAEVRVERMKYILLSVHSHPKDETGNGYITPSPQDFEWLHFISCLNSVMCDDAGSKPIGIVLSLWDEERLLRLSMYQQKDIFPDGDVSKLVGMVEEGVVKVPHKEYEGQYWKVVEQLNVGRAYYDVKQDVFLNTAYLGWKEKKAKRLSLQGFLGKFAYDLVQS